MDACSNANAGNCGLTPCDILLGILGGSESVIIVELGLIVVPFVLVLGKRPASTGLEARPDRRARRVVAVY